MKIDIWDPSKEYSELDCVRILGRAYLLTDRNREIDEINHLNIKTNKLPLRRVTYKNLVKERSNREFIEELFDYFPDNEEDQLGYWKKL